MRRSVKSVLIVLVAALAVPATAQAGDTARYILPPGNFGGLPTTTNSLDQLPLYDALTPLRGNITRAEHQRPLPARELPPDRRHPRGEHRPSGPQAGLRLLRHPHVYGKTRADMAFGAGWTTARDRGLLLQVGRGPARVAVADVPGINAFGLVPGARSFTPSPEAEALVTAQKDLLVKTYGAKGRQILRRRPGLRRRRQRLPGVHRRLQRAGHGQRRDRRDRLHRLDLRRRRRRRGQQLRAAGEAEAGARPGARLQGLGRPDARRGSRGAHHDQEVLRLPACSPAALRSARSSSTRARSSRSTRASRSAPPPLGAADCRGRRLGRAAPRPPGVELPGRRAVRSATHNSLATMGPQLGYYYPEIVQQIDLHGPGIKAQGVGVPGLAMYILIGRTQNYAWSLTSANHDVRDVFAERLCNPDGSPATRASTHYLYKGAVPGARGLQRRAARRRRRWATASRCTGRSSAPPPSAASRTRCRASAPRSAATPST